MIPAGKLRHRITIQRLVETLDEYNDPVVTWEDVATNVPTSVEPLQGREFYQAQQAQSEVTVRFRIRYRSGLDASMRIVFEGRYFGIISPPIDPNMQHRELHLMCAEKSYAQG